MEIRFDTPFEIRGSFTAKMNNSKSVQGSLRYEPHKGLELDLTDRPVEGNNIFDFDQNVEVIHGYLINGTKVTLENCFLKNGTLSLNGDMGSLVSYGINRALFGIHVPSIGELRAKEYRIEYSSISEWLGHNPFVSNTQEGVCEIVYRPFSGLIINKIRAGIDLRVFTRRTQNESLCQSLIKWHAEMCIAAHEDVSLEQFDKLSWSLRNMLSLLIGHQISIRNINIVLGDECLPLSIIFHQRGRNDYKDVDHSRMLLPYGEIEKEFEDIVLKWFSRSEQSGLATDIYFGMQCAESMPLHMKYLSIVQALESYHRSLGGGYMDQEEYRKLIEQMHCHIPEEITGDHRQSLKDRLKWGYEYSLRKRLNDLFSRIPDNVQKWITKDRKAFIEKVKETRNYHTHYDHSSLAKRFEGIDMHIAAERLRILFVANVLCDLGLDHRTILPSLKRNREFNYCANHDL